MAVEGKACVETGMAWRCKLLFENVDEEGEAE